MIFHNLFFLVLAASVWFTLVPLIEDAARDERAQQLLLIQELVSSPESLLNKLEKRVGTASELQIPPTVQSLLDAEPGRLRPDATTPDFVYLKEAQFGNYMRLRIPDGLQTGLARRFRVTLCVVLGVVYCLVVLTLELALMKVYVYKPLSRLLDADESARRGDSTHELIDESLIFDDELGQLMRSRNATIVNLRQREEDLAATLQQLAEAAEDLKNKNYLLEAAKRNIADQDRLVSLGLLSASLAHELNTPLAVIRGSIEQIIEAPRDPALQERLNRVLRATTRLQKMSESLLGFSRVRKEDVQEVYLRSLVDEAWSLVSLGRGGIGTRFRNEIQADDHVTGNYDRLLQLFVNLIRNALNAISEAGHVLVWTRHDAAENGAAQLVVFVDDDGPGIPPGTMSHIFEAFVTTRLDARGTGLGLTVAEGIVHQHGGSISAINRDGGGARLEVRLPCASVSAAGP
jgi:two-component system NtrC family sensor kinase